MKHEFQAHAKCTSLSSLHIFFFYKRFVSRATCVGWRGSRFSWTFFSRQFVSHRNTKWMKNSFFVFSSILTFTSFIILRKERYTLFKRIRSRVAVESNERFYEGGFIFIWIFVSCLFLLREGTPHIFLTRSKDVIDKAYPKFSETLMFA